MFAVKSFLFDKINTCSRLNTVKQPLPKGNNGKNKMVMEFEILGELPYWQLCISHRRHLRTANFMLIDSSLYKKRLLYILISSFMYCSRLDDGSPLYLCVLHCNCRHCYRCHSASPVCTTVLTPV